MRLRSMRLDSALDLLPPFILTLDFLLLGSGVRKWSAQTWASRLSALLSNVLTTNLFLANRRESRKRGICQCR